jgi:aspartate 1-decarboxylase
LAIWQKRGTPRDGPRIAPDLALGVVRLTIERESCGSSAIFQEIAINVKLLKAKLHQACVTQTDLNYHGSITVDTDLLRATGLFPNEQVLVADCDNGNRFETYIIPGPAGSGIIGINGAAARLSAVGNRVIVMAFVSVPPDEVEKHVARIVVLDRSNKVIERIEQKSSLR